MQARFYVMSGGEQEEWIIRKRLQGNRLFKFKMYEKAIEAYLQALIGAKLISDTNLDTIICNLASCMIMQGKNSAAEMLVTQVLEEHPTMARALERRAIARVNLHKYDEANADIELCYKLTVDESILAKLEQHKTRLNREVGAQRSLYRKMMKGGEGGELDFEIPAVVGYVVGVVAYPFKVVRGIFGKVCKRKKEKRRRS